MTRHGPPISLGRIPPREGRFTPRQAPDPFETAEDKRRALNSITDRVIRGRGWCWDTIDATIDLERSKR
jgi:hypothetical protein